MYNVGVFVALIFHFFVVIVHVLNYFINRLVTTFNQLMYTPLTLSHVLLQRYSPEVETNLTDIYIYRERDLNNTSFSRHITFFCVCVCVNFSSFLFSSLSLFFFCQLNMSVML